MQKTHAWEQMYTHTVSGDASGSSSPASSTDSRPDRTLLVVFRSLGKREMVSVSVATVNSSVIAAVAVVNCLESIVPSLKLVMTTSACGKVMIGLSGCISEEF